MFGKMLDENLLDPPSCNKFLIDDQGGQAQSGLLVASIYQIDTKQRCIAGPTFRENDSKCFSLASCGLFMHIWRTRSTSTCSLLRTPSTRSVSAKNGKLNSAFERIIRRSNFVNEVAEFCLFNEEFVLKQNGVAEFCLFHAFHSSVLISF